MQKPYLGCIKLIQFNDAAVAILALKVCIEVRLDFKP